jgi:acyl carrier protein
VTKIAKSCSAGANEDEENNRQGTDNNLSTREDVFNVVCEAVRSLVGQSIEPNMPLLDAGLDSISAIEFADNLSSTFSTQLPPSLIFDHPTISHVCTHIMEKYTHNPCTAMQQEKVCSTLPKSTEQSTATRCSIKITAEIAPSGCVLQNHVADCINHNPRNSSFGAIEILNRDPRLNLGNFVHDIAAFDYCSFGISRPEAMSMDPQQRMLLLCVAPLFPQQHLNLCTSIFIGISWTEYGELIRRVCGFTSSRARATSQALSVASGRISYTFDLHGPALSVDTACSSSLVAAHLGVRSICEEESQSSVVGGVNLILAECTTLMFMHAGMLAPDGRCKSLDARADGYVRAENCGVCVFTSHGDDNETLVSGTAINQDGRTSTLTAPNASYCISTPVRIKCSRRRSCS